MRPAGELALYISMFFLAASAAGVVWIFYLYFDSDRS